MKRLKTRALGQLLTFAATLVTVDAFGADASKPLLWCTSAANHWPRWFLDVRPHPQGGMELVTLVHDPDGQGHEHKYKSWGTLLLAGTSVLVDFDGELTGRLNGTGDTTDSMDAQLAIFEPFDLVDMQCTVPKR